uniref:C2H2-type domain-containing protein n=1 Tax=Stomoxys calcitrans TaxID=35570 RepID=A0A1I8PEB3_STOCA
MAVASLMSCTDLSAIIFPTSECWHSLNEFCEFQQMIEKAQEKLHQQLPDTVNMISDFVIFEAIEDNLHIKVEEEFISEPQQVVVETSLAFSDITTTSIEIIEDNFLKSEEEKNPQTALDFFDIQNEDASVSNKDIQELSASYDGCEERDANLELNSNKVNDDKLIAATLQELQPSCSKFNGKDDGTNSSDDDDLPLAIRYAKAKSSTLKASKPKPQENAEISQPLANNNIKLFDEYFAQVMPAVKCRTLQLHMVREHPLQKPSISVEDNLKMGRELVEELKNNDATILDDLVFTWVPSIQCVTCPEIFSKYSAYREHFQKIHTHKDFYLSCCGLKLPIHKKVLDHMLFHNNPDTFKCKACSKTFTNEFNLQAHIRSFHMTVQDKKFSCQQCTKAFTTHRGLNFHCARKHSVLNMPEEAIQTDGSSVYNCKYCNYSTQSYSHRWGKHNPRKAYACQICGEGFILAKLLRDHLDEHAGNSKNYSCSICGKKCKNFTKLIKHKQAYHDQQGIESRTKRRKKHACSICSVKFAYAARLRIHMQSIHRGKLIKKSRISCTLCPLKFTNPSHFRLHLRKKHGKTSLEIKQELADNDDVEVVQEEEQSLNGIS